MKRNKSGKYSTPATPKIRKGMPIWLVVLIDALMVGVILLSFALVHHVIPKYAAEKQMQEMLANVTEPVATEPEETVPPETETVPMTEPEVVTEPDPRTPWQIKFEDKFTDEVVVTENSYTSQEVAVFMEKISTKIEDRAVTYFVADIYVAGIENFKTYIAYDSFVYFMDEDPVSMAKKTNSIVAIDGDFATVQKNGFVVRNSNVYLSDLANGICVMYPDGSIRTYEKDTYVIDDILAQEPVHVWSFGPSLLDESGKAIEEFQLSNAIAGRHPRGAIGYYEPGHYCFVVADGRDFDYSEGLKMHELAQVFEDLGCRAAYNLDGGATASMIFMDSIVNKPYDGGRKVSDIIYIGEAAQ